MTLWTMYLTARTRQQQQRLANLISHFLFVHLKSPDTLRLNINSSYIQKQLNVAIESLPDGLMACSGCEYADILLTGGFQ